MPVHYAKVLRKTLIDPNGRTSEEKITGYLSVKPECFDTEASASNQCFARDLKSKETLKDLVEDLMCQLLWAFNVPIDNSLIREKVRKQIEREFL